MQELGDPMGDWMRMNETLGACMWYYYSIDGMSISASSMRSFSIASLAMLQIGVST